MGWYGLDAGGRLASLTTTRISNYDLGTSNGLLKFRRKEKRCVAGLQSDRLGGP